MDGRNTRVFGLVNISRDFANAFFVPPPFGPEGAGVVAFGEIEGEPMVALDVVAHEFGHGVVYHSVSNHTGSDIFDNFSIASRLGPASFVDREGATHSCPTTRFETLDGDFEVVTAPTVCVGGRFLLASSHAGAIHEAYADIVAEATAFHHRDNAGTESDYRQGSEKEAVGVIRSLRDPRALSGCLPLRFLALGFLGRIRHLFRHREALRRWRRADPWPAALWGEPPCPA